MARIAIEGVSPLDLKNIPSFEHVGFAVSSLDVRLMFCSSCEPPGVKHSLCSGLKPQRSSEGSVVEWSAQESCETVSTSGES